MTFFVRLQPDGARPAALSPAPAVVAPAVVAPAVVAPAVAAAVVAPAAAPVVVAPAVVAPAAAAAVLTPLLAPAAVATAKKRKHYLCRLKKCPKCGHRATSNRQLACAADLCDHVYLPHSKYKKAKLVYKVAPQKLCDIDIEELDDIFDVSVPQSLTADIVDFFVQGLSSLPNETPSGLFDDELIT